MYHVTLAGCLEFSRKPDTIIKEIATLVGRQSLLDAVTEQNVWASHPGTTGGMHMPLIQVKIIEGVFSPEQKQEIVKKLTDAMVSIEGENMRQVTMCIVEEIKSGDWGIGGKPLTTDDVKALAAGGAKC